MKKHGVFDVIPCSMANLDFIKMMPVNKVHTYIIGFVW